MGIVTIYCGTHVELNDSEFKSLSDTGKFSKFLRTRHPELFDSDYPEFRWDVEDIHLIDERGILGKTLGIAGRAHYEFVQDGDYDSRYPYFGKNAFHAVIKAFTSHARPYHENNPPEFSKYYEIEGTVEPFFLCHPDIFINGYAHFYLALVKLLNSRKFVENEEEVQKGFKIIPTKRLNILVKPPYPENLRAVVEPIKSYNPGLESKEIIEDAKKLRFSNPLIGNLFNYPFQKR